eukprot:TRINITY_DN7378_c0_g1_i1.p1 TRINITY_DN7378_c0_g1~~TRINITY_DN7378_c0_g1_i1.p1  ORF type:complete len:197 (-),score=42.85 TRINITY_DN7378_c0_g1_i1:1-591(-)
MLFEDQLTKRDITLVNTHLYWGCRTVAENFQLQIFQAEIMMDRLAKFTSANNSDNSNSNTTSQNSNSNSMGVIICGDFNGEEHGATFQFLKNGNLPAQHPDITRDEINPPCEEDMWHPFTLKNAFKQDDRDSGLPYSAKTVAFQGWIDHIWLNENLSTKSILELHETEVYEEETALPSSMFGSDHIMLLADVVFKK